MPGRCGVAAWTHIDIQRSALVQTPVIKVAAPDACLTGTSQAMGFEGEWRLLGSANLSVGLTTAGAPLAPLAHAPLPPPS